MRFSNTSESKHGKKQSLLLFCFLPIFTIKRDTTRRPRRHRWECIARTCTETFFECSVLALGTVASPERSIPTQICTRVELFFESSVTVSVASACTEVFFECALAEGRGASWRASTELCAATERWILVLTKGFLKNFLRNFLKNNS